MPRIIDIHCVHPFLEKNCYFRNDFVGSMLDDVRNELMHNALNSGGTEMSLKSIWGTVTLLLDDSALRDGCFC